MNEVGKPSHGPSWLFVLINAILCVFILAVAAAAVKLITESEPKPEQIETVRRSAALVETITVDKGTYSPILAVLGTVEPAQEIVLSPRVDGQVVELSPEFMPGGMVGKGDLLFRIDPADFENAVSIRKSELEQAEASLKIEEGRVRLAEQELELLEESISDANTELVLRKPQLASIKAQVSAAKAAVQRAELDLARTKVVAPFDAQIISRSVNLGSQIRPGDDSGRIVGVDEYWVNAAVPVRSLGHIQFPDSDQPGSFVTLTNPDIWGDDTRSGSVSRMIGALDEQTRLARVLVTVPDPLGSSPGQPALILDTLIKAEIKGTPIHDVVRLSRDYVRDGDTVWVMQKDQLEIRKVKIEFRDADDAYIREGLNDGDEVVTTTLATVANGVSLRKVEESPPSESSENEEAQD